MRGLTRDVVLYVGSAWWRDCDPFVRVVAATAKGAADALGRAMVEAAENAAESDDANGNEARTVADYLDDIAWSGVSPESYRAACEDWSPFKRDFAQAKSDLRANGVAYLNTY